MHTEGVDPFSRTRKQAIKKAISLSEIALLSMGAAGIEPTTSTTSRWHSPAELRAQAKRM